MNSNPPMNDASIRAPYETPTLEQHEMYLCVTGLSVVIGALEVPSIPD